MEYELYIEFSWKSKFNLESKSLAFNNCEDSQTSVYELQLISHAMHKRELHWIIQQDVAS